MRRPARRKAAAVALLGTGVGLLLVWATRYSWAPTLAADAVRNHAAAGRSAWSPAAAALGDAGVEGVQAAWFEGDNKSIRVAACHTLSRIATPRSRDALCAMLIAAKGGTHSEDLTAVVSSLGHVDDEIANALLFAVARDTSCPRPTRAYAVALLIVNEPADLSPRLTELVREDIDGVLAEKIIYKLRLRGDHVYDEVIRLYLKHPEAAVRQRAAKALGESPPRRAYSSTRRLT